MNTELIHTPEGVRDIYGNEYEKKLKVQEILREQIQLYGYSDIQTPTFEYLEVFGKEIGTTPVKDLFKFFDADGNILCLRPDFTPSMARCAAKYFADDKLPVRLCYLGNTFSNTSILQGKLKETTQMGAELMGDDSVQADAEMIAMLIDALKKTGLKEFQVNIGEIDFFHGLCESVNLSPLQEDTVREYIFNKNYLAAKEYLESEKLSLSQIDLLMSIEDLYGRTDMFERAESLSDHPLCIKAITRFKELHEILTVYGVEKYVSFDLSMLSSYHYYTGIIFQVFTFGVGDVIVKGGRYDKLLPYFGKDSAAIGFVIMIDDLMQALSRQRIELLEEKEKILIVYQSDLWKEAMKLAKEHRDKNIHVQLIRKEDSKEISIYEAFAKHHAYHHVIYLVHGNN